VDRQRQRETNPKYDRVAYGHNTISGRRNGTELEKAIGIVSPANITVPMQAIDNGSISVVAYIFALDTGIPGSR